MVGLLVCSTLLAVCSFTKAVTLDQAYSSINTMGDQIRERESAALRDAANEAFASASNPLQRSCITDQRATAFDELNTGLGEQLSELRKAYGRQSVEELARLDLMALQSAIGRRLEDAVSSVGYRIARMRHCVTAYSRGKSDRVDNVLVIGGFAIVWLWERILRTST